MSDSHRKAAVARAANLLADIVMILGTNRVREYIDSLDQRSPEPLADACEECAKLRDTNLKLTTKLRGRFYVAELAAKLMKLLEYDDE